MTRLLRWLAFAAVLTLGPAPMACKGTGPGGCCRECQYGTKPCGDVCIAISVTCQVGKGCACAAPGSTVPGPITP